MPWAFSCCPCATGLQLLSLRTTGVCDDSLAGEEVLEFVEVYPLLSAFRVVQARWHVLKQFPAETKTKQQHQQHKGASVSPLHPSCHFGLGVECGSFEAISCSPR